MSVSSPSVLPPRHLPLRQVPTHDTLVLRERRSRYAIVVPVINEGTRIRDQLLRMRDCGASALADVIITDGGSTDGSLTPDMLRNADVRALLTKTGPGKVSAQLRIGYAFALDEGYEGIVTIDGNGKDSVTSIALFVEALENGVDYAQASRFVPGGRAINTPRIRDLAIRLIHAPALSMAARHHFTDTTQGFRAYSRRYLEHPGVQPFRDIFSGYELLAYLTVRAPQLGLAVAEIPTTRTYPPDGSVPTKLTAWGNASLLGILWRTLRKRYHPEPRS